MELRKALTSLTGELAISNGDLESQGLWLPDWAGGALGVHPEVHTGLVNVHDALVLQYHTAYLVAEAPSFLFQMWPVVQTTPGH